MRTRAFYMAILTCSTIALLGCLSSPYQQSDTGQALLDEAINAAGGEVALRQAQTLHWTGQATVIAGARELVIDVDTTVSPFAYARSETQLLGDPKIAPRTLELRGDEGWIEVGDKRSKMPEAMETHERLQYATYGLMRLVSLRDEGATITLRPDRDKLRVLQVQHPSAATSELLFDHEGRLVAI